MLLGSMLAQHHESPSRVSLTLLVTTEIEGREAVVADSQLLGGRVCGRLQDGDTVVLLNVLSANSPIQRPVLISPVLYPSTRICGATQRNQTRAMLPSKFKTKGLGLLFPNSTPTLDSPSTCAAASSCRHCPDRGTGAWRAY
jgi:hypothetical protein